MSRLAKLLTRPFRSASRDAVMAPPDRRAAERFDTTLPVSLRRADEPPFAGSLINISIKGAAITLHGWNVPFPAPWPTKLRHGDELELTGLIGAPLPAWVVAREDGVLRVRFLLDDTVRDRLHALIDRLRAASRRTAAGGSAT